MTELLEALAGIAAYVALIGVIVWILYLAFGTQVFGVPALIAVLVIVAGGQVVGNVGAIGFVAIVIALVGLVAVIGIAMTLGPEGRGSPAKEKPQEDLRA
jgi:hypothetical protein